MIIRIYLNDRMLYDIEMTKYSNRIKMKHKNPLIGHVHKPNSSEFLMGTMVNINSDGFRDNEYSTLKKKKYRMIFLGDSLTFGWGVEKESTFENLLEIEISKILPVEIINFGTGNYNTEQEVNLFFEKGLKYSADKVVVFYFINDAETTPQKSPLAFLAYSRMISLIWSRIHVLMAINMESKNFKSYYAGLYEADREGWRNATNAFLKLKSECEKLNIRLQVVLLPELHDVKHTLFNKEYDLIGSFFNEHNIEYLNLMSLFSDYNDPPKLWVASDDAHPNKLAHQIIAQASIDFLAKDLSGERN